MDELQARDLNKFQGNLELIAKTLDLASHPVRSAFGRQPLFNAHPELKEQFKDVMETLNHLMESCRNLANPES